jgi:hypothetical protein
LYYTGLFDIINGRIPEALRAIKQNETGEWD